MVTGLGPLSLGLRADGCESNHSQDGRFCSEKPMEYLSCYEPSCQAEEEVDVIDVGGDCRCGDCHERIIQGDSKDSLGVDALSWLAEGVGKGARHIYSCYHKYRYGL